MFGLINNEVRRFQSDAELWEFINENVNNLWAAIQYVEIRYYLRLSNYADGTYLKFGNTSGEEGFVLTIEKTESDTYEVLFHEV